MKKKKIPYGIQNLEKLINDNCYFIDKTKYIKVIEDLHESYPIFLRPRKFGKTLWLDILSNYYDINKKNNFDKIFDKLWIKDNPTPKKSSYYILNFDFSGIQIGEGKEVLKESFKNRVLDYLIEFNEKYNFNFIIEKNQTEPANILSTFLSDIQCLNLPNKIYLLIDEYDHFANKLLGFNEDLFKNTVSKAGFVRNFYEIIKNGCKTVIDRLFITGVSPITLDSMTSGFNIAANLTKDKILNSMLGFTKKEVQEMLKYYEIPEKVLYDMERCYDGYCFTESINSEKVFNSDMVLYFLKEYKKEQKEPYEIIDENIASDYKKIQNIININEHYDELQQIMTGPVKDIKFIKSFNIWTEKDKNLEVISEVVSRLFYLGFLTINNFKDEDGFDEIGYQIPNYAMELLYTEYFNQNIINKFEKIQFQKLRKSLRKLAYKGEISPLLIEMEKTLNSASNLDNRWINEIGVKLIFLSYLRLVNYFVVKSEYEVESKRIDIMCFKYLKDTRFNVIIEFKYLTEKQNTPENIQKFTEQARNQIKEYTSFEEIKNLPNLQKYIVIYAGHKLVVNEKVF